MTDHKGGRANQRLRTRKQLLEAAAELMAEGRTPSLDDVAERALVSRATAYRYFPGTDALLREAALDVAVPPAAAILAGSRPDDAVGRLAAIDKALHDMVLANEAPLRLMLAHTLEQSATGNTSGTPLRQNRRSPLIDAALAPIQDRFDPAALGKLKAALALIIGTEAMLVFRDVLNLDDAQARAVKHWAIEALVKAAARR